MARLVNPSFESMKKRQDTAWAILSGAIILPWSIRRTKKEAVNGMLEHCQMGGWEFLKAAGYRVVEVELHFLG